MSRSRELLVWTALAATLAAPAFAGKLGLGRPALPEEIVAWDVALLPDGTGLPAGAGDVETGEEVFLEACAACHGEFAEGLDSWPVLAEGDGTLTDRRPVKTVGSYWPHLSTGFDYVHRSMPSGGAQTVSVDDTYAITAFLLYSNGLVEDDFVLSHENFSDIVMANADGFYPDDRPETEYPLFSAEPCLENCRTSTPEVTKRAVDLGVKPTDPDGKPAGTLPSLALAAIDGGTTVPESAPQEAAAAAAAAGDPALNGGVGHGAGRVEGFRYSPAFGEADAADLVWDEPSLDAYLENPRAFLRGTAMAFAGLRDKGERAAVIAFLASFGN